MDIFVRNVPVHASNRQLEKYFVKPFAECDIHIFLVDKIRGKPLANITVLETEKALQFLTLYGVPQNSQPSVKAKKRLWWEGKYVLLSKSRNDPKDFSVRSLAYEESQRAAKSSSLVPWQAGQQNKDITRFAISGLQCGSWDYPGDRLSFTAHYNSAWQGTVSFGSNEAVMLLGGVDVGQYRVDISYYDCSGIVLGGLRRSRSFVYSEKRPKVL